jgi:hypothetical protein
MGDFTVNVRQKPMDFNRWQLGLLLNDYGQQTHLAVTYLPNIKAPSFPRLRLGEPTIISREGMILLQRNHRLRGFVTPLSQQDAIIGWLKSEALTQSHRVPVAMQSKSFALLEIHEELDLRG